MLCRGETIYVLGKIKIKIPSNFFKSFLLCYRLNERVLKTENSKWLNLIGTVPENTDYKKWSSQDMSTWLMEQIRYLYVPRKNVVNHLYNIWIAVDLELESGRKLLEETLHYLVRKYL